jgi:eukaryotic-like serine/threonine-protein kinase
VRFATPAQVMEAASARLMAKEGPSLLERLERSGTLSAERRALLESMVDAALATNDRGPNPILASVAGATLVPEASGREESPGTGVRPIPEPALIVPLEREGQFARLGEIGRGGHSVVLRALDRFTGREVALKELLPGADNLPTASSSSIGARFLREVRVTAQLDHPGIVSVHELGRRLNGTLFCVQKLIRGETLKVHLARCASLQERLDLLPHVIDACQAIAHAHSRGVIHRDLKPSNIMVGPFGETVVVDWGLAKNRGDAEQTEVAPTPQTPTDPGLTVAGVALGTPAYMSPEQARGAPAEVDERSDIFCLGAILYELLCGRPPREGVSADHIIEKALAGQILPLRLVCPEVPPDLAAIAERALQPRPSDRYPSAQALAKELNAYRTGDRVQAYEYRPWELTRRFVTRRRSLSVAVGLALVILAGAAVNTWRQLRPHRPPPQLSEPARSSTSRR